jgi:PiT family inorganic phosphate transporter
MMYETTFIIMAVGFGLFMAWGVGANDVANAMGTSIGSKALTVRRAILIAAIFEFAGAFFAGGAVTGTISKGITDIGFFTGQPELLVYGMLASLLAAAVWLMIASRYGWPVSTSHSIVGAIVGFTAVGIGVEAVHWDKVGTIAMSWVISPVLGMVFSYLLFMSVQRFIFNAKDPFVAAKRYVPAYIFLCAFIIFMVTFVKGLKYIGLDFTFQADILWSLLLSLFVTLIGIKLVKRVQADPQAEREFHYASVEKVFAVLMTFTACAMAFAHGSNDVANAVGPLAAVVNIVSNHGELTATSATPAWILFLGGGGIVLGLITYGHKVIATIGTNITELTPSRGFAATLGAAAVVILASGIGLPISTTHTLVGAVLGVGLARGIGAINLRVVMTIFTSWIVTLPAGALLSIIAFFSFKYIFGG